jgi:predicted transcriptional regulator
MMKGLIKIRKNTLETWLKGCGISESQLAKDLDIDQGNFSRMVSGVLEPSKSFIKKLMMRTGYGFDALFDLDREAISEDKDNDK